MKKFYKIPMTERVIKVNNVSLIEMLHNNYPDLYNREKGRVELMYGDNSYKIIKPQLEHRIKEYNETTDMLYQKLEVPKYIIAIEEEDEIKEYATKTILEVPSCSSILSGRRISKESAYYYLDNTKNYIGVTAKIFGIEEKKIKKKSLFQRVISSICARKDN